VLRLELDSDNAASLPQAELSAAPLRTIIVIIRVLGKHRLLADGYSHNHSDDQLLTAASEVLSNWPENFFRLLRDLAGMGASSNSQSLRRRFGSLLDALCKNKTIEVRSDVDFVLRAFMDFAEREQDGPAVDPRLLRQYRSAALKKTSLAEISRRLRIQPRAAYRLLEVQSVPLRRVEHGRSSRYIVDASSFSFMTDGQGKIIRVREAAKILGVQVALLQMLRKAGVFKVKHMAPGRSGFHSCDVELFARSVALQTVDEVSEALQAHRLIRVRDVGHGCADALEVRVRLLDAIVSGRILVHGSGDGTVGGTLLDVFGVEEFVAEFRKRSGAIGMASREAAKVLACDPGAIRGLIQRGHLHLLRATNNLDASLVSQFHFTYVALATLAKDWRTSSRALTAACQRGSLQLIQAEVGANRGPQSFLLRSDVPELSAVRAWPPGSPSFQSDRKHSAQRTKMDSQEIS
jgi:hypothetical protein